MQFFESIVLPLQAAIAAAWIFIALITFTRFRKFTRYGYINLTHILRAGFWGELAILAEILRRLIIGLAQESLVPVSWEHAFRSWVGMTPVWALMAVAAYECLMLFKNQRFEKIAAEHEARLQIGRLATRLHVVSESLDQRNNDLEKANKALGVAERKFRDFFENAPLHYHTLNRDGIILESNELEAKDLGYKRDELIGVHISKIFHKDNVHVDQATLDHFWKTGRHAGTEVVLAKKDGSPIPVRLYSTAVRDEEGNIKAARTIWIDITAEKQAQSEVERRTHELRSKNRELESRNRELSEVSHVISHDIKAPLRGIEAFLNFLEEDCGPNLGTAGRSHVATIRDSCGRLRRMIDDLIEYARFGQGGKFEAMKLERIVTEIVEGFRLNLHAKKAEIRIAPDLPEIFADRVQLEVLIRNLVDNAIKYGRPERPVVEIGCQSDPQSDHHVILFVKDNGIGIPEEHQEKIFGLFQRLHGPGQYEGSGIGLALVKKAAEFHGGRIWVESEIGKGSTFFVSLPRPIHARIPYTAPPAEKSVRTPEGNRVIFG